MPKYRVVISVIEEYPYEVEAPDEQTARHFAERTFAEEGSHQGDYREVSCREIK
jgi:hypothetical protein